MKNPSGGTPYTYEKKRGRGEYLSKFFSLRVEGSPTSVAVHRLQAYQKYGEILFEPRVVVRHLNGDPLDNSYDNIAIGTQRQNLLDRDPEERLTHSRKAARVLRKLSEEDRDALLSDRAAGMTYSQLVDKYHIAKSTVSYIVRGLTYK